MALADQRLDIGPWTSFRLCLRLAAEGGFLQMAAGHFAVRIRTAIGWHLW